MSPDEELATTIESMIANAIGSADMEYVEDLDREQLAALVLAIGAHAAGITGAEEAPDEVPVVDAAALTAQDRCDRCGAQAYLRVELVSGSELLFCAHHAREHEQALISEGGLVITDERSKVSRA